ncbi:entericidin A/B family lipoprotein [Roseovarius sp. SCSIO 43702]|nr:entericidin A/B family lipoprotein [Roseovarius sp. SCSIO 43702]QYX57785.1 entericidin A/B family lipoprotein [Roseovarius sp. SCSIO 43702]
MTRYILTALSLTAFLGLSACETVEGAGRDIEKAGQNIEDAAEDAS